MMNNFLIRDDTAAQDTLFHVSGIGKRMETDEKEGQTGLKGNSLYVGNLFTKQDIVSRNFALKQKNAVKRVLDQFQQDMATDDEMRALTEHAETLGDAIRESTQQIKGVDERRAEIRERYEIDPYSQEQKDLELMQKVNTANEHPFDPEYQLTDEEMERYRNLPPATEYQKEMLECDKEEKKYRADRQKAQREAIVDKATVHATQKALLKVTAKNSMVGAQEDAKKMMESALKGMAFDLMQEGVDNVDEKAQETQEKMAEAQEEALKEKIEREKLKEEEADREKAQQELESTVLSAEMQAVSGTQKAVGNLQQNIKGLVQEQILLDVDLKGLRVDKQV